MTPLKSLDTSGWTRDDLIREARLQTDAIQRLNVWLRLGYSLVAAGFIVGYWGFYGGGGTGFGVLGVVLLALGAVVSVVLKVGTTNAKKNVQGLMAAAGVDISKRRPAEKGDGADDAAKGDGADDAAEGDGAPNDDADDAAEGAKLS